MERFNVSIKEGLTDKQVNERINQGFINKSSIPTTKSIKQIILMHTFTLFNVLNFSLGILILLVKSYRNLMFLGVVFCNTIIGIYQEIKAKKIVDRLSLISAKKVLVMRNSKLQEIHFEDVVLDDIIYYKLGNQIVSDGVILSGSCEVNESFVTGESDPILKKKGDYILSGSFIVSGNIVAKADKVGKENYVSTISDGAKYIKKVNSEIMATINKIIKILSITIIPIGIILFIKQVNIPGNTMQSSVVNTVAAMIGMIPEGLVLLTSSVFMVSIIRLSKYNVLVQELYCTENLARIDTICLDKTGTITEGTMEVVDIVPFSQFSKKDVEDILSNLSNNLDDENPTMMAIKEVYKNNDFTTADMVYNFSSINKFSGIEINGVSYLMGAFDYLLESDNLEVAYKYSEDNRVLAIVKKESFDKNNLSDNVPIGLVLLKDKIRNNAINTINYFKSQNVDVKIISGDNPITVSSIAKRVGINGYDKYVDASELVTKDDIEKAVKKYNIFGRVKPEQKKIIIASLKKIGKNVAYAGDGVNDVLALKESDCSITFQNGSEAARNVSQLVLLDSDFGSIPKIVLEGRRSINNIERSASLFLVKTTYSALLSIIFLFLNTAYPFVPIQLTLTSVVTIGIPSFVLALEPNKEKVSGHFFPKVISKSLPAAFTIVLNIILVMLVKGLFHFNQVETSTVCVILTGMTGFILLYRLCKPFNLLRSILLIMMVLMFFFQVIGLREMYELAVITPYMIIYILILTIISYIIFNLMMNLVEKKIIPKLKQQ